ncbi:hypothetical protein LINPERHAP1_LOCUS26640 [Linum perenne]
MNPPLGQLEMSQKDKFDACCFNGSSGFVLYFRMN